jgi:hypothetical protein
MTAMPPEPTLLDTINRWRAEGYGADFMVVGNELRCRQCNDTHDPHAAEILDVARFEGASDPDDEAAAYALRCVHCGTMGILVTAYGPSASAEEADVVVALEDARRGRG